MTVEAVNSETQKNEISNDEPEKGDLNGREVEIQNHKDNAKNSIKEFGKDCIKGAAALSSGAALPAAAGVIVIIDGSQKLITACEEYGKAVELENLERGLDKFGNPIRKEIEIEGSYDVNNYERENDRDSWDCEY